MTIYDFAPTGISLLKETTFSGCGLQERRDIQRLLRENIEVVDFNALVIAEEFGNWENSRRRIDPGESGEKITW